MIRSGVSSMRSWKLFPAVLLAGITLSSGSFSPAFASEKNKQQTLVDKATLTVQDMFSDAKSTSRIQRYLIKSRAVLICPSIFRMSIGIGGSGGGCVLLARDASGSWSDPAFYTLSSGSIGIQLGMDDSQVMLFIMTDRGLQTLLDNQIQLGASAAASFATIGTGIEDGTAGRSDTDIMGLQKSKGLFAGASLGGSKLTVNSSANRNYYQKTIGPEGIVINMQVNNPGADPLRSILMRMSANTATTQQSAASPSAVNPTLDEDNYTPSSAGGAIKSQSLPAQTTGGSRGY